MCNSMHIMSKQDLSTAYRHSCNFARLARLLQPDL